ncbi:MAG: CBS domain-containing protein [Pseudorhodoplanes sp.]|nr:CBS domain-containing protein [Pseudorhodoplanes sp.]
MKARDVMSSPVIAVGPDFAIVDVAKLFLDRNISGAPVVDDDGVVVGIIAEGDLIFRSEIGTERPHPDWFRQMAREEFLATEYVKAQARLVKDVMQRRVITASPEATLNEICALMENNSIKRVLIISDGDVVGIVTRSNILQALASGPKDLEISVSDLQIRTDLLAHLSQQRWAHLSRLNIIVHDRGVVDLWGFATSEVEKQALRVAAENTAGVCTVNDHVRLQEPVPQPEIERDITTR